MQLIELVKRKSRRFFQSIAFIPALVVFLFLLCSAGMIYFDYSEAGRQLKSDFDWIRLKDPSTARTIVSVIAAGLISLTVFSFSMVMVVLNQAASQLSNRVVDRLIGNKLQQFVLGFYIGTIIYSLLLLSAIRDIESGIYVPALSTYLLIFLSVVALFLFVFFLHYITQSLKYAVIIRRIFAETLVSLQNTCGLSTEPELVAHVPGRPVPAHQSGIFESFNKEALTLILTKHQCCLSFAHYRGQFVLEGVPLYYLHGGPENLPGKINEYIAMVAEPSVQEDFGHGFRQLTEIAIKALSPGINDPGTAMESMRVLMRLLAYRLKHYPHNAVTDDDGNVRIITKEKSFGQLFEQSLLPIWDYGHKDRLLQRELTALLLQLQTLKNDDAISNLLKQVNGNTES